MKRFPEKEFEEFAKAVMKEHDMPGISVSVVSGEDVIYKNGFGYRDKEAGLPATPDTIFGVASVSKSFTALAVMQLQEAGKLSVSDPVQKYIPSFDLPGGGGEVVTIHNFLTHTSSLPPLPYLDYSIEDNTPRDPDDEGETGKDAAQRELVKADSAQSDSAKSSSARVNSAAAKEHAAEQGPSAKSARAEDPVKKPGFGPRVPVNTYDQLVDAIKTGTIPLLGKPGEYCSYSNDCYGLLGVIIEATSGESFEEYMRKHILQPLTMDRSAYSLEWLRAQENYTTLYYKDEDKKMKTSTNWQVAPPFVPCGWLKSTVLDLAHYLSMHVGDGVFRGNRLLSPEGIKAMRTGYADYSRDRRYAYGFSNLPFHGASLVEHSGGLKGVSSQVGFVPEEKIGAAVLCNLSGAPSGKIMLGAINLMLGLPADAPRSVYNKDSWPLDELVTRTGMFKSGEGGEIILTAQDGKLIAEAGKLKREVLRDSAEFGVVNMDGVDSEVRFLFDGRGKLWAIGWGGRIIRKSGEA